MNILTQDTYIKAWNFASRVHNGQFIPGTNVPYINHIGLVTMESMCAVIQSGQISNPDLLILCSILHDTIEDTGTTYENIKILFGVDAANGVNALSKNKKLPTKREQMIDSINRIKAQPLEVWMVKLCDRITNLQPPPEHWDKEKISAYKTEAELILSELGPSNTFLEERLRKKINGYNRFI